MSSQTMTAPAVGHRPPDPGPDTPMCDYGGSQNDASPPSDSRSDSAVRDMHNNSAPTSKGLPATPIGIKTEPSDSQDLSMTENHKEINTQSAAGALLAQLLGNQSAPNAAPANGHSAVQWTEVKNEKQDNSHRQSIDQSGDPLWRPSLARGQTEPFR